METDYYSTPLVPMEAMPVSSWRKLASCAGVDPELFFPDHYQLRVGVMAAKAVCQSCPVQLECLTEAMEYEEDTFGIFGGLTPKERRELGSRSR
jgi:WhiB family redox-sensing transcriptional regulator